VRAPAGRHRQTRQDRESRPVRTIQAGFAQRLRCAVIMQISAGASRPQRGAIV
jgi:hypothetical protein